MWLYFSAQGACVSPARVVEKRQHRWSCRKSSGCKRGIGQSPPSRSTSRCAIFFPSNLSPSGPHIPITLLVRPDPGVFKRSWRLKVPRYLVFSSKQNGTGGSLFRVGHLSVGRQRPGTWFALRSALRVRKKTLHTLISTRKCGAQPVRSLPPPRYPARVPVVVDVDKTQPRRRQVLAAMEGRSG